MYLPKICHRQRVLPEECSQLLLCSSEAVQLHWERTPNQICYWQSSAIGKQKKKQTNKKFIWHRISVSWYCTNTLHYNHIHVHEHVTITGCQNVLDQNKIVWTLDFWFLSPVVKKITWAKNESQNVHYCSNSKKLMNINYISYSHVQSCTHLLP